MWVLSVFVVGTFCVYKKGTSVSLQDSRVLVGVSRYNVSYPSDRGKVTGGERPLFPGMMLPPLVFALNSAVVCQVMLFTRVWLDAHRSDLELKLTCREG